MPIKTDSFSYTPKRDREQTNIANEATRNSLERVANKKIYTETNIYSEEFKMQLMEFCHYYQIPFLDSNIPKSTHNAAKIYYKIL